jgi:hypothetical protein
MTRAEQLALWRQGYEAGYAAGLREHHDLELAGHQAAIARFRAQSYADQQAAVGALLAEVVDVLARALLDHAEAA